MANSVKDLKFNELPEELRDSVIKAAQKIRTTVKEEITSDEYREIQNNPWGLDKVHEFLVWFQNGVGSARVYKKGDRYSCMIQITGHVDHVEEDPHCLIFKKMIKRVYTKSRTECKKLGFNLVSEGDCGDPFEGFDLWTDSKQAKELWEKYPDREEKPIHEIKEDAVVDIPPKQEDVLTDEKKADKTPNDSKTSVSMKELPKHLQDLIEHTNFMLYEFVDLAKKSFNGRYAFYGFENALKSIGGFTESSVCIGDTVLWKENGTYFGTTVLTAPISIRNSEIDRLMEYSCDKFNEQFETKYPLKHVILTGDDSLVQFEMAYDSEYAKALWDRIDAHPVYESVFSFPRTEMIKECSEYMFEPYLEDEDSNSVMVRDMTSTLMKIPNIDHPKESPSQKVTQILSSISKIVSKGSIQEWGEGWKDLNIKLFSGPNKDGKYIPAFAFDLPKEMYSKEFASRFIRGHESFHGFQHRSPDITIRLNTAALATMKKETDLYDVLKAAVQYYSKGIEELANKMQSEFGKFPEEFKKMMLESKLYKLVGISLEQLVLFDNVDLSKPKQMFSIPKKNSDSALVAIRGLPKKPVSDKKEQDKIISDYKALFRSYYECGSENFLNSDFLESLSDFMNGKFDQMMKYYREYYHECQVNVDWTAKQKDPELKYLQEKFGVKKLKKIPTDLVSYITIETESIRDTNDKMMIASYCLSKLEIVEWYIELLEVGSKKYIVPHTLPWLNNVRTQLLACYDRIMRVRILPSSERPILGEIRYPNGYEG